MPAIGITGGIATGKSIFSEALCRHLPAELFDADRCSHDLLAQDPDVREAILSAFGRRAFDTTGRAARAWLREVVFADAAKRRVLEQILHPAIRARWVARAEIASGNDRWFCVDIPLLYETRAQSYFGAVVVVACSAATQRSRLLQKRHLTSDLSEQIIAAQLDLAGKIRQADHLIWNDSSTSCLDRQARLLAGYLRQRHG